MRRRLVVLALVVSAGSLAACDRNDGRQMREPTDYQVWRLENTTPTTTSTTTTVPPATAEAPPTTPPETAGTDGGAILPGEVPDLAQTGMTFSGPWPDGAEIDPVYTCDGEDAAPELTWTAPPDGTAELALVVTDDDADDFVHWVVVGLPPEAGSVGGDGPVVDGSEGVNQFGRSGWGGPCPPPVSGTHSYRFTLFALSQQLELPADSPHDDLLLAIEGTASGTVTLTGTYTRPQ